MGDHSAMSGRVILFGATGYTGRLTAQSLAQRGITDTVLAGRNESSLQELAAQLRIEHDWDVEVAVADVATPRTVSALVNSSDDVLISTVGPFSVHGGPAIEAATSTGAIYIDSTGEPPFIRRVFEYYGPRAHRTGATLLTAFGYDYIPGNLAGVLALRDAREAGFITDRLEIGYFIDSHGSPDRTISGGTAASSVAILTQAGFAFRDGGIVTERPAAHVREFELDGRQLAGLSLGGTEHFTLPRIDHNLREVSVFLGWAGPQTAKLAKLRGVLDPFTRIPYSGTLVSSVGRRFVKGSTGGPSATERAQSRTIAVAEAFLGERRVGRAVVKGPNPYELTADLLAMAADAARKGDLGLGSARRTGALGPADAFGQTAFIRGCRSVALLAAH